MVMVAMGISPFRILLPVLLPELGGGKASEAAEGTAEIAGVGKTAFFHDNTDFQTGFCQVLFRGSNAAGLQITHDRTACDALEKMRKIRHTETALLRQLSQSEGLVILIFQSALKPLDGIKGAFAEIRENLGHLPVQKDQQLLREQIQHITTERTAALLFLQKLLAKVRDRLGTACTVQYIPELCRAVKEYGKDLGQVGIRWHFRGDLQHIPPVIVGTGSNGMLLKPAENQNVTRACGFNMPVYPQLSRTCRDENDLMAIVIMDGCFGLPVGKGHGLDHGMHRLNLLYML